MGCARSELTLFPQYIVPVPSRGSWSPRNPSSPSGSVLEVTGEESKPSTAVVVANGGGGGDKPPGSSKGGKGESPQHITNPTFPGRLHDLR